MTSRTWGPDGGGIPISSANLNGMEADITTGVNGGQDQGFLFGVFTGNGTAFEKLSLFYSGDGKTVSGGHANPVYADPNTGTSLRDPSVMKIGTTWFCAYTVNNGYSKNLGIIKSTDLLNWSQVMLVDVSAVSGLTQAWAPELVKDTNGDIYIVFTAVTSSTSSFWYIKATDATGLSAWTAPTQLSWTSAPTNPIDATFAYDGTKWYMFYKNDASASKYIEQASSTTLTGTYTTTQTGNWAGWGSGVEAPEVVQLPNGTWRIYMDRYNAGTGYAYSENSSLSSASGWSTLTGVNLGPDFPMGQQLRHGSIIRLADGASRATAIGATMGVPLSKHAECTASASVTATVGTTAGTLTLDSTASNRAGDFLSLSTNQATITVAGYYSVDWMGDHSGFAAGSGAYMAVKGPSNTPIYASVDLPTASGAASLAMASRYLAAGTVLTFPCQFGTTMTVNSRIVIHKHR
jgi:hypothetical protein